jgi:hypothetical protein
MIANKLFQTVVSLEPYDEKIEEFLHEIDFNMPLNTRCSEAFV